VAFGVQDFQDLIRLLEQHPEWRADLRRLVLTDELLELPAVVRDLAEQVRALAEAQRRTDADLVELRQVVRELAEAQRRTEEEVRALAEAQRQMAVDLSALRVVVGDMRDQLGTLRGRELERQYREHAGAYFDDILHRARLLSRQQLADLLDAAQDEGRFTPAERRDVLLADLVVSGRRPVDGAEVYLVVEVSVGVGLEDVERAARRAALLGRLRPSLAAVAGERITREAEAQAQARGVWRVLDGGATAPSGAA
jgi:hypothetical protein